MVMREAFLDIIDRFEKAPVVLYGDLVLDRFILGTPKRISREAPVIILRHEKQEDIPGGAANALHNLVALGAQVTPIGVVGNDEPGEALTAALAAGGADTSGLITVAGFRTPTKVRILGGGPSSLKHQVARYDIEDELGDEPGWREELLARLSAVDCAAVAVSDYGYGSVFSEAIAQMRSDGLPWICLDSRSRVGELEGVDAATPNLGELEAFAGKDLEGDEEVATAAADLRRQIGARFVLATRGNCGMTLAEENMPVVHIPVFGMDEVADVTGAGDTVLAVLTLALATGAEPEIAARLANYAGGIVVMKLGTATLTRGELRDAVERDFLGCQA